MSSPITNGFGILERQLSDSSSISYSYKTYILHITGSVIAICLHGLLMTLEINNRLSDLGKGWKTHLGYQKFCKLVH